MSLNRVGRILAVFLVTLLLLEVVARIASPVLEKKVPAFYYRQYFSKLVKFDEVFAWSGIPGATAEIMNPLGEKIAYRINRNGWRGREFTPLAQPGNALVFGDSFAFGTGVAENARFGDRLEGKFRGLNVWTFAQMGYAPDQYALLGLRWLTAFPWAFLVIQLSNNDLQDTIQHMWGPVGGSGLPATISPPASYFFFSDFSEAWNLAMTFLVSQRIPESELRKGLTRLLYPLEKNLLLAKDLKIPVFLLQASDWGAPAYGEKIADDYRSAVRVLAHRYGAILLEANQDFPAELLPAPDFHWTAATHEKVAEALFLRVRELPSFQPQKAAQVSKEKQKKKK